MIINHNMASLNTYNKYSTNNSNTSKSLEKLSSGLRINRAGDDAAGLAISEKMRGQIRGLDQASRNAQDANSLLNTAEGNLSETQNILQRMKELATQAANDTNVGVDRGEIQKEINQLTSEINRIGNTTEFNTQKLLNGGGTDATIKNAGVLTIPAQLTGGQIGSGTATRQLTKTFSLAAGSGFVAADDGKTITFNLGGKDVTFTLNKNLNAAASTATQIGIADVSASATLSANAIETALNLAIQADDGLRNTYSLSVVSNRDIVISAKPLNFSNGKLTGTDAGVNGKIEFSTSAAFSKVTTTEAVTSAALGAYATASIDFTGKTAADLKGTGFVIDGEKVDFYDSTDGTYTGNAEFAIDLKGVGSPEAIVDKVVSALYNTTGVATTKFGQPVAAGASYLPDVYVSKDNEDSSKLVITAKKSGIAGNSIMLADNSNESVSNLIGSDKLSNENVVSAKGLKEGQQTVTVTYKSATSTEMTASAGDLSAAGGVSITSTTAFDSGTYRLTNQGALNHAQLQTLGSDGSTWTTVAGYEDIDMSTGTPKTVGDLSITGLNAGSFTAAAANTNNYQFKIEKQHYEATLTEKDGTVGPAVAVTSGQKNVSIKAQDGVGEAVVDIGDISSDLAIGASTTFNFTASKGSTTEISGGTYKATFQIGANTGQSMSIEINDMRSVAIAVSGKSAGGKATVDGAVFTATKDVTNGTDNTGVEYALDVSDYKKATSAIKVLGNAIEKVSAERSKIGAYTNRLEHTVANLSTSSENLTSAESRIRDVDMAKEMMNFQKNNILSQAAQAMLAQANQQPQGVLQLLR